MNSKSDHLFTYGADSTWLARQARPFYYSVIFILIFLEFYNLALFYAIFGVGLLWFLDEEDKIIDELDTLGEKIASIGGDMQHRVIRLSFMGDFLQDVVEGPNYINRSLYNQFRYNLDNISFTEKNNIDPFFNNFKYANLGIALSKCQIKEMIENSQTLKKNFVGNLNDHKIITDKHKKSSSKIIKVDPRLKVDVHLFEAALEREENRKKFQDQIAIYKQRLLRASNFKERRLIKQRLRKMAQFTSDIDEDLLLLQASLQSQNVVRLGKFFRSGLYPISEFDFDRIIYKSAKNIIHDEYFVFNKYSKELEKSKEADQSYADYYLNKLLNNK